jgi:hypothetical protein
MKCLNRTEMQEFIDKEVGKNIESEVMLHLEHCKECSLLYREAAEDKVLVNNFLNQAEYLNEGETVPEFKRPAIIKRKSISTRLILDLAAASLIGLIIFFNYGRKQELVKMPEADLIMYEFLDGKDLNKLWHDKSQILILQDEQGNVIESTIKY